MFLLELKTLTWGLIRTALLPIRVRRLELVTEEDKESSSKKRVICDVVEEPAKKLLLTAPPEDLPHSHCSLLQLRECSSLQDDSPSREPENLDRCPVRAM